MIGQYPLIPDEAFLYFPSESSILQIRENTPHRIIFGGGLPFSQQQMQRLAMLKGALSSQYKKQHLLKFTDDLLLRFLQATGYTISETVQALEEYYLWEQKNVPIQLTPVCFRHLSKGIIYLCGRDCYYRPIIVMDVKKILDSKMKQSQLLQTLGFFFQYIIENCLIEGQVQNWNTIIDLGNCSAFSLGSTLLDIIKHMSSIFRARLNRNYLLRCPSSMKILWGMVKKVLNEDQLRKISISQRKVLKEQDFITINHHQIQEKYGGKHPNIQNYWPIQIVPYQIPVTNQKIQLLTEDQYHSFYLQGRLNNRKVKKTLLKNNKLNRKLSAEQRKQSLKIQSIQKNVQQQQQVMYLDQKIPPILHSLEIGFTYKELFNFL